MFTGLRGVLARARVGQGALAASASSATTVAPFFALKRGPYGASATSSAAPSSSNHAFSTAVAAAAVASKPAMATAASSATPTTAAAQQQPVGRLIAELPCSKPVMKHFDCPMAWHAKDIVFDDVCLTFSEEAGKQLRSYIEARCFKPGELEVLMEKGVPADELHSVRKELAHMCHRMENERGFFVIRTHTNGQVPEPDYTRFASVLMSVLMGRLLPQDAKQTKSVTVHNRNPRKTMQQGARYHQTRQGSGALE